MSNGYAILMLIAAAALLVIATIPLIIPIGMALAVIVAVMMSKKHG